MNSNTFTLFLFILIIICAIYYLVMINNKENSCIEKFSQTNSLSTMYQQTIDDNEFQHKYRKNEYNQYYKEENGSFTESLLESMWNGNWNDGENPPSVFASFLELNDQIIFSLSKQSFPLVDENIGANTENEKCLNNTFVGIGHLNSKKNMFVLKKILCKLDDSTDKIFINNLNLNVDELIGTATLDGITLKDGNNEHNLILNIKKSLHEYDNYSSYLQLSSFVNPIPVLKSDFDADLDVCANSTFDDHDRGSLQRCYIKNNGLAIPPNDGFNTYGTGCSLPGQISQESYTDTEGNTKSYPVCASDTKETCWISETNRNSVGSFTECDTQFEINRKFSTGLTQGFTNSLGCDYLQNFNQGMYNCCILLYVNDLHSVESLSYEYFGQGGGKSNLTMQNDISSIIIEPLLKKYKGYITGSNTDNSQLQQALSLTNCFSTKDSITTYSELLQNCKTTLITEFESKSNDNQSMKNVKNYKLPMVWSINKVSNANYTPCTFSISSSKLYTKESQWQKFAEFDPNHNKTKMSLYEGGTNQVINLENATILTESKDSTSSSSGINTNHILVSGNLKTSNPKKFLIPSKVKSGFYHDSSIINLKNSPNDNGKWIMFGFHLMNIQNLKKTLEAIQAKL